MRLPKILVLIMPPAAGPLEIFGPARVKLPGMLKGSRAFFHALPIDHVSG